MANNLGIKRYWFHKNHYDIPKRKIDEITGKCTLVSPKEIVKIIRLCSSMDRVEVFET